MYNPNNYTQGIHLTLHNKIDRENLILLMTLFYERTLKNETLAPFFTNELGEDMNNDAWQDHINLLADFWLAKLLGQNTYEGNVFGMHTRVPNIRRKSFDIWMELFSLCTDETYTEEVSTMFKDKARLFSEQFITFLKI